MNMQVKLTSAELAHVVTLTDSGLWGYDAKETIERLIAEKLRELIRAGEIRNPKS